MVTVLIPVMLTGLARPDPAFAEPRNWRAWDAFRQGFIQSDGRVIEHEANGRTTSEGQAYAMFFALVSNDLTLFERLLRWTEDNLAHGNLKNHLPGWQWGQNPGGEWRTLDDHSASDADLWMAYALLEAGRLWQVPRIARGSCPRVQLAMAALKTQRVVVALQAL